MIRRGRAAGPRPGEGLLQQALFLVELLGARMERDAGAGVAVAAWIALPLAWPASSSLREFSFHIALVTS